MTNLKQIRIEAELSQRELAHRLGISQASLSGYEKRGLEPPQTAAMHKRIRLIAEALGVEMIDLYDTEPEKVA
jgi:transcriptional regulator with XRE-family HTH domain